MDSAASRLPAIGNGHRTLYLASSAEKELARLAQQLAELLRANAPPSLTWHYQPMLNESHATIYHPAALEALRRLFKPGPEHR